MVIFSQTNTELSGPKLYMNDHRSLILDIHHCYFNCFHGSIKHWNVWTQCVDGDHQMIIKKIPRFLFIHKNIEDGHHGHAFYFSDTDSRYSIPRSSLIHRIVNKIVPVKRTNELVIWFFFKRKKKVND